MKDENTTRIMAAAPHMPSGEGTTSLVLIHGDQLGKRFPVDPEANLGRADDNTIVLDHDNVSRHHARVYRRSGGCFVTDLGSTNGTWVNDVEVEGEQALEHGDLVQVGSVVFKLISGSNPEAQYHEEIYRLTILDGLTQIHNQRYFTEFLERELSRFSRSGGALSLILFDIDDFKSLNDTYGHLLGDRILREIAALVNARVRHEQLLARYGGDEFAIILPDTEMSGATVFAEKIRGLVERYAFHAESREARTTLSLGVACIHEAMTSAAFLRLADEALYAAKRAGGNAVRSSLADQRVEA